MNGTLHACAFVALGSNLDAPLERVCEAMALIDTAAFGRIIARSSCYRTAPVGQLDQPDFINAVIALQTSLAPVLLMRALLDLESRLGRVRAERNGPRRIDLDLIAYEQRCIDTPELQLPHPRAIDRAFVMLPWAEIAPDTRIAGVTVREIALALPCQRIARIEA
ncbi:MAG: 2-amino-4-hydroxy-6-hydroxymethyldihydropteridine diphosphokinase [Rhodanobacteraceae bacterium]|nr:2-amino-4-hydroxy-6-hydroxymethyldihydropteridine diphosphokinase [Rhodanobacteraceae bacterium]MBP9154502.1 2-amino-4-hydroxy-6-hydroxymethyldihydropteridine diphosphokinase [Xanthomonadales bacterium]